MKKVAFFCDLLKIPHVACLVDSPNNFVPLIRSPYTIITCVDRFACEFFREMQFDKVIFMPHAVEKNLICHEEKANYEVLMLASCIDYETIAEEWKKKYPQEIVKLLKEAAEKALEKEGVSYIQIFVELFNQYITEHPHENIEEYDYLDMLDEIEIYMRGVDRVKTIKLIHKSEVHVFGRDESEKGWQYYLKGNRNVIVHPSVPFEEALLLMQQSKIVLNSCPWIQDGGHERIFYGQACNALIATRKNPFLENYYTQGENILYIEDKTFDDQVFAFVKDDVLRKKVAAKGRSTAMQHHTWDKRAAHLLKELPAFIREIQETHETRGQDILP